MEKEEFIIENLAGNIASRLYEGILQYTNTEKETHTLFNKVIMELYNHYRYK